MACGKPAEYICTECIYDVENPYFCEKHMKKHEHDDMCLLIANSPRSGVCGYEGNTKYDFTGDLNLDLKNCRNIRGLSVFRNSAG